MGIRIGLYLDFISSIRASFHFVVINLVLCCLISPVLARTVDYKLDVSEKEVNFSGKAVHALALNNQIPGPALKAVVGDTFRVSVTNHLKVDTSIHWHGVLVPPSMDGVPYINGPPIKPGETFVYEFPITHSGTYWYHAHSALQEQQGLYGALVFYDRDESALRQNREREYRGHDYDEEQIIVLSDWSDESPEKILKHLKSDPDYYALKKDTVQSWLKVIRNGIGAVKIRLKNAWARMGPMDMSDIGYDAFLINGQKSSIISNAGPGKKIKLRIINAAASTYFVVEYSGGEMKIIEADGMKVVPFTAQKIRLAMAETYDVIVTVPDSESGRKKFELRATSEDGTGFAVAHIGQGELMPVDTYPKPNLVMMDMSMGEHSMGHSTIAHEEMSHTANHHHSSMHNAELKVNHVQYLNSYNILKSPSSTRLPMDHPTQVVHLKLTGSMQRYVWTLNDIPMYAADFIKVKNGQNVKFVLENKTMMNHPIHLHGHFFRVLNGQDEHSPLKHTVNVAPFEKVEIEFKADKEKDWIFHCHNLYHMKLGMGGIIHYDDGRPSESVMKHASLHAHEHGNIWFNINKVHVYSNFGLIKSHLTRHNENFRIEFRHNYYQAFESELVYQRYMSEFWGLYVGSKIERRAGKSRMDNDRKFEQKMQIQGIVGVVYTLPLLVKMDLRANSHGKIRFGLYNEHQMTNRTSFEWNWNTDKEYTLELAYELSKTWSMAVDYDAREKWGAGLTLKF